VQAIRCSFLSEPPAMRPTTVTDCSHFREVISARLKPQSFILISCLRNNKNTVFIQGMTNKLAGFT
jgi:hypothetical protein